VEAWRQCSAADFVLFVILLALKKVVVSVGAILYVVALLAKAVFFERLTGGQRTGVCMFLAVVNLLLSICRDDFGMKVFVGAGVGLIMLVLLVNGNVMSAAGISIFGISYNYHGGGLVVSLVSCIGGWMVLGVGIWPLLPLSVGGGPPSQNDDHDDMEEEDMGSSASRSARRAAAMAAAQAGGSSWGGKGDAGSGADVPAKKKKGKGKRRA
jgi:hypothetical protein